MQYETFAISPFKVPLKVTRPGEINAKCRDEDVAARTSRLSGFETAVTTAAASLSVAVTGEKRRSQTTTAFAVDRRE